MRCGVTRAFQSSLPFASHLCVPVGEPRCRAPPGLFVPLPGSFLQASCPLPALPEGLLSTGSLHCPGGTVLGPCSVRFSIYSQLYQHKEDRSLSRSQATYLEFVSSFSFLIDLIFPSFPTPFLFRFLSNPFCAFWPSSSHHGFGLILPWLQPGLVWAERSFPGKEESSLPAPES